MKRITLLLLAGMMLSMAAYAQKRGMSYFYHKYKSASYTEGLHIPHILLRFAADDAESKKVIKLIRSLDILNVAKKNNPDMEELKADLYKAIQSDHYEDLIRVSSDGDNIALYFTEGRRDRINNLILIVDEQDELTFIHLRTKLTSAHLNKLMSGMNGSKPAKGWDGILSALSGSAGS